MSKPVSAVVQSLEAMLKIASPTGQEQDFNHWFVEQMQRICPHWQVTEHKDSLIFAPEAAETSLPHICLVGHSDVVPEHFTPRYEDGRLHGSGASDMKGALAAFLQLLQQWGDELEKHYRLSLVVYAREEQTPLVDNGLYHLIEAHPAFFKSIDTAIIGEPTDNTLQLGCVGSIHAELTVKGKACHSARPWNGENAIYKALPLMQQIAGLSPVAHDIFGLTFYDVVQLTESQSQPGRTSLPGWWKGNVNFRFAPTRSESEAWDFLKTQIQAEHFGAELTLRDSVPAGQVVRNPCFEALMQGFKALGVPLEPKQAWTDVAQLTAHGIAAFNFGPGLTAQAHTEDEHILVHDLEHYLHLLHEVLRSSYPHD
jgi:succinyl-diaminopimelate desuccinylase